jgi:hypothetical protein
MSTIVVHANDRRVVRRLAGIPCQVVTDWGFRLVGRRVLDLSSDGMLVRHEGRMVELGEEVIVSFRAPTSQMWLDAVGVVTRLVHGRRPTDNGRALGIRFLEMDAADRAVLAGKLHGLPPPAPARHLRVDYAATLVSILAA